MMPCCLCSECMMPLILNMRPNFYFKWKQSSSDDNFAITSIDVSYDSVIPIDAIVRTRKLLGFL